MTDLKTVQTYWETRSPGITHSDEVIGTEAFFDQVERERFTDPLKYRYLKGVAEFGDHTGKRVLEVGLGLGTDCLQFARAGSEVYGIDLTHRAVELTGERFLQKGLSGTFKKASFTEIPFPDDYFDVVYSFGVLHHSEQTQEGISEIYRVLKPGGRAIVMLYHKGFKYYVRKLFLYGVLRGEFLRHTPQEVVNRHSETFGMCPLTKAYSRRGAAQMFRDFANLKMSCYRLDDDFPVAGQPLSLTRAILPASVYRRVENRLGWNLIVKAHKPG